MHVLLSLWANFSFQDPTLWYALGSGLVVMFLFLFFGRRSVGTPILSEKHDANLLKAAIDWVPVEPRMDERRSSVRRGGMPTAIHILDSKNSRRAKEAYVLDRSTGGIRMATQKPYSTGTTLQVRPQNAPSDTPWVHIIVRNCREIGDYYEVGCQFDQELPWNILLLFG